jgi:hypothetical protein
MPNPNRISTGEVIAGRYISKTGITFGDGTNQDTAASPSRYLSCFDTTTQAGSTTAGVPYRFNTTDASRDISVISDGSYLTKIKNTYAGVYNFIWSGQFENSVNTAKDIYVWFKVNGTDVVGSTGLAAVPGSHGAIHGHAIIGWNFFLNLPANAETQIYWLKETADISLVYYSETANYPSTASVVLTVNQIA